MTDVASNVHPQHEAPGGGSKTEAAKSAATDVASGAKEATASVAQTAAEQAKDVAAQASAQARDLLGESKSQLQEQARKTQSTAATGLAAIADELRQMTERGETSGTATEIVRQASDKAQGLAAWLRDREPGDALEEIRDFARRKPGVFLLGALAAGVVAGRVFRATADGAAAASLADSGTSSTYGSDYGTGTGTSYAGTSGLGAETSTTGGGFSTTDDADPLFGSYSSTDRPGTTGGDTLHPDPTLTTPASTDSSTTGLSGQRTQDTP
jgi:hypothetical protein